MIEIMCKRLYIIENLRKAVCLRMFTVIMIILAPLLDMHIKNAGVVDKKPKILMGQFYYVFEIKHNLGQQSTDIL